MSEFGCAEASRSDLAQGAREHYEALAKECSHWYSLIPKAIDSWEKEPELIARAEAAEKRVAELEERLRRAEGVVDLLLSHHTVHQEQQAAFQYRRDYPSPIIRAIGKEPTDEA